MIYIADCEETFPSPVLGHKLYVPEGYYLPACSIKWFYRMLEPHISHTIVYWYLEENVTPYSECKNKPNMKQAASTVLMLPCLTYSSTQKMDESCTS